MMRLIFAALAAAVLMAAPGAAAAQGQILNPSQVLNGFRQADMEALGRELGYKVSVIDPGDGSLAIEYVTPEGFIFYIAPNACNAAQQTCFGLMLTARISDNPAIPVEALNYYNSQRAFTQAISEDGTVFLRRYIIGDFGVPKGNVAVNFSVFVNIAVDLDGYLRAGMSAPSFSLRAPSPPMGYHGLAPLNAAGALTADGAGLDNAFDAKSFAKMKNLRPFKGQ